MPGVPPRVLQMAVGEEGRWHGVVVGALSALAAILAYLPTQTLGLQEGFWAAITAIAVMRTEMQAARSTARDQFLGAATGGAVGLGVTLLLGYHVWSYGLAVIGAIAVCSLLRVPSAGRLAGITATIILLVPHGNLSPMQIAFWRVSEVGWGLFVSVVIAWLATRIWDRLSRDALG
jgi:uncharacterized membrane protein YccC